MTYKKWFKQVQKGSDELTEYEISRFNDMDIHQHKKIIYSLKYGELFGGDNIEAKEATEVFKSLYFLSGDLDTIKEKSREFLYGWFKFRNKRDSR